jgi:SAM-dependent methyltransferase
MDTWRWYDITHRDHEICNPISSDRLDELIRLLDLPPRLRVLDIGAGKGELAIRLVERHGARVVAIDRSPYAVADLRRAAAARVPGADLEVLEMDAADHHPADASFDLTICLGATWIHGGLARTLVALARATRPGGRIVVGHPHWRRPPAPEYLAESGLRLDDAGSVESNVTAGLAVGLHPWLVMASSEAEWDRYETLQWRAAERFLEAHPDDPDAAEVRARVDRERSEYLRWGRDTLGWGAYVFAKPAAPRSA